MLLLLPSSVSLVSMFRKKMFEHTCSPHVQHSFLTMQSSAQHKTEKYPFQMKARAHA
jgi:hypothetical protein